MSHEPLIEMTVLTENDPDTAKLICQLAEHMTNQGGHLAVNKDSETGQITAGYHFAEEEPGSEMAGGAAYGTGNTVRAALQGVADDIGFKRDTSGPSLQVYAEDLLWPTRDIGHQIDRFVNSRPVQLWLQEKARRNLGNPLLNPGPEFVQRWTAFAASPGLREQAEEEPPRAL